MSINRLLSSTTAVFLGIATCLLLFASPVTAAEQGSVAKQFNLNVNGRDVSGKYPSVTPVTKVITNRLLFLFAYRLLAQLSHVHDRFDPRTMDERPTQQSVQSETELRIRRKPLAYSPYPRKSLMVWLPR